MATSDDQIKVLHAAGLRVIVAGEDDTGRWTVSIAKSRTASMNTWKAGSGPSFAEALAKAMSFTRKPAKAEKPAATSFEDML